jgi:peptide chain release factor 1
VEGRLRRALQQALLRAEEVGRELTDPLVARDPSKLKALGREHTRLAPVVRLAERLARLDSELAQARELADEFDPELAALARADLTRIPPQIDAVTQELHELLRPQDPHDARDAIVEIRAGTGGDEAALFAADLYRMYQRFSERNRLSWEPLSLSEGTLGGLKEAIVAVRGDGAYGLLRRESGVHRVQRVPATETQGRIHTSAATVAVLPEAEEVDIRIEDKDIRVDVFRSSGPGGQSVNTTDSAVRITHLPTGLVVSQQDQKSQQQNKLKAMEVLRARLLDRMIAEQESARARERRAMVGTGDRSAKIRNYNFPQSRVTDHRINLSVHNLGDVIDGHLDQLVDALRMASRQEQDGA